MDSSMKVGTLARRTGLTVRTLHHYDEIGLLSPSERTPSGHRLYGADEIERLQRIASLRHLGLALDEIKDALDSSEYTLERVLELQIDRIRDEVARNERLRGLLQHLLDRLRSGEGASIDDLAATIEVTMSTEKYYTPEQRRYLVRRRDAVGQERIEEVQKEWEELFAAFRDAKERGLDPGSDEVLALARRSEALVEEFTGGDPGIRASLARMYREEGGERIMRAYGLDTSGLWEYIGAAQKALRARKSAD